MLIPNRVFILIENYSGKYLLGSLVDAVNIDGRTLLVRWKSKGYLFRKAKRSTKIL